MTRQAKIIVTIALMLGMTLAALDTTIVGTAMPSIVGKLGGITLYSWVFSAYLLTSTTTVPIYGKLADLYGRKPLFLFGSILFLIGSVASGASQNMVQLILFRALQGLGAGAVQPIVLTIIGDIFVLRERARVQGLFSGVWGLASIIGPALGGIIVDYFSWRWVFFINVPFGLVSAVLLAISLKENVERTAHRMDYIGTLTLSGSVVALLFAFLQGGISWAWFSWQSIGLFIAAIVLLGYFLFEERRASEPILPLTLFNNRIIVISSIGGFILGVVMFGITTYVPLFMQGVKGGNAIDAGIILGPLLLAWPITATISGKIVIRYGYRLTAMMGAILSTIGVALVLLFNPHSGLPLIIFATVLIGAGLGFSSSAYILSVQNSVPWNLRGVATASTQFFRTIGGTIGVAIMGSILNGQMALHFSPIFTQYPAVGRLLPVGISPENVLLTPNVRAALPGAFVSLLQDALSQSLFWVYSLMFVLSVIGIVAMLWLPGGRADEHIYQPDTDQVDDSGSSMLAHMG